MLKGKYHMLRPHGEKTYISEMFEHIKKYWEENEKNVYHIDSLMAEFSGIDLTPILQVVFQFVFLKTIEAKIKNQNLSNFQKSQILIQTALELEKDFTSYLTILANNELKYLDSERDKEK